MKRTFYFLTILVAALSQAQVGINTETPEATLDVNGDLRVQDIPNENMIAPEDNCPCFIAVDADGNIVKFPISQFDSDAFTSTTDSGMPLAGDNGVLIPPMAIKDRNFGDGVHDFIYMPVKGPDGRTWLNNNLGAGYANIHTDYFDPLMQAISTEDYRAFGSLFQWQRAADGHELVHYGSGSTPYFTPTTTELSTDLSPDHADFIVSSEPGYSWTVPDIIVELQNNWDVDGVNNPCPVGYRPPTGAELENLLTFVSDVPDLYNTTLKLSRGYYRHFGTGEDYDDYYRGVYYANDGTGFGSYYRIGFVSGLNQNLITAYGASVRCIKHE